MFALQAHVRRRVITSKLSLPHLRKSCRVTPARPWPYPESNSSNSCIALNDRCNQKIKIESTMENVIKIQLPWLREFYRSHFSSYHGPFNQILHWQLSFRLACHAQLLLPGIGCPPGIGCSWYIRFNLQYRHNFNFPRIRFQFPRLRILFPTV